MVHCDGKTQALKEDYHLPVWMTCERKLEASRGFQLLELPSREGYLMATLAMHPGPP